MSEIKYKGDEGMPESDDEFDGSYEFGLDSDSSNESEPDTVENESDILHQQSLSDILHQQPLYPYWIEWNELSINDGTCKPSLSSRIKNGISNLFNSEKRRKLKELQKIQNIKTAIDKDRLNRSIINKRLSHRSIWDRDEKEYTSSNEYLRSRCQELLEEVQDDKKSIDLLKQQRDTANNTIESLQKENILLKEEIEKLTNKETFLMKDPGYLELT